MVARGGELVGLHVDVVVSDPWELTASDGSVRFPARVVQAMTFASGADEERVVIEFRDPVEWHGDSFRFFVAQHRHRAGLAEELVRGRSVECGLTAVSEERASSPDPFDVSWWRGGLAVVATVEPRL